MRKLTNIIILTFDNFQQKCECGTVEERLNETIKYQTENFGWNFKELKTNFSCECDVMVYHLIFTMEKP